MEKCESKKLKLVCYVNIATWDLAFVKFLVVLKGMVQVIYNLSQAIESVMQFLDYVLFC